MLNKHLGIIYRYDEFMSPSYFDVGASAAREFNQNATGNANGNNNVSNVNGLRPDSYYD